MRISELIEKLEEIKTTHGDLEIRAKTYKWAARHYIESVMVEKPPGPRGGEHVEPIVLLMD